MSVPATRAGIESLVAAVNRLTLAFERAEAATSSSTTVQVPIISQACWELVEPPAHTPWAVPTTFTGVEEGPTKIPHSLLVSAASEISSVVGKLEDRVQRAWRSGSCLVNHTEYEQLESLGSLSDTQWVIIRAPSLSSPVRVRKVSELRALLAVAPRGDFGPIYQGFPSLTEVQVFCAAAGIDTPPVFQCSTHK